MAEFVAFLGKFTVEFLVEFWTFCFCRTFNQNLPPCFTHHYGAALSCPPQHRKGLLHSGVVDGGISPRSTGDEAKGQPCHCSISSGWIQRSTCTRGCVLQGLSHPAIGSGRESHSCVPGSSVGEQRTPGNDACMPDRGVRFIVCERSNIARSGHCLVSTCSSARICLMR